MISQLFYSLHSIYRSIHYLESSNLVFGEIRNNSSKEWNISQSKSQPTENFITVHRFIQQLKSWIRGIYHWVSDNHLQAYLDEFCFRFNRHLFKDSIFNTLVNRMMKHNPELKAKFIYYSNCKLSIPWNFFPI